MAEGKILMVDDDKEIADLVEIHLKGEGYQVYKAYNGKEALEIFDAEEIDLAILDIMMPGMDGNEVCAKIRQTSTIPIIMLSAKDSESDKVSGLVNGADDYVTKPFNTSELIARVNSQLRRYHSFGGVESKTSDGWTRVCMRLKHMEIRSNLHRLSLIYFFLWLHIQTKFFLQMRFLSVSGKKKVLK